MASRVMVVWSLILLTFWMSVFGFFNKFFDGAEYERAKMASLEKQMRHGRREVAMLQLKFSEYKDAIALAGIKIDPETKWSDPKRMIASELADVEFKDLPRIRPGNDLYEKAKKLFGAGDYERASELFEDYVSKYPDSPYLPEAHYLLSESFYQTEQIERTNKEIDLVITQFPETQFAGLCLLRLASIFERQDRNDDAVEIYQLVEKNFPKSKAATIASKNRKELAL